VRTQSENLAFKKAPSGFKPGNHLTTLKLLEAYPHGLDHKMTHAPQSLMAAPLLTLLGREEEAM
jgi:hypothetical protein